MSLLNKILMIMAVALGILAFPNTTVAQLTYTFTSGTDVAVTSSNYTASGALNLTLAFTPTPGTNLTVVKNTGLPFISGTFDGVPQGGIVPLSYNGVTYNYIANYYGGNGRSLLLQWPCMGLDEWGQLPIENYLSTMSPVPIPVQTSGVLLNKVVIAIAEGDHHSLVLTSDGRVFTWGQNNNGELGNGTTTVGRTPAPVSTDGVLAGKTVIAVAGGFYHSLALTSDGQVLTWGNWGGGLVPVSVSASGALAGKTVIGIAAGGAGGAGASMALTSEGKIFTWGSSLNPQETPLGEALDGKKVVCIAAGRSHNLVLSSDGQVFAWGDNSRGQLGNNSTTNSSVPVAVGGALAGKTVISIAARSYSSLAVTSDGQVFAWGQNTWGQIGNDSTTNSLIPVRVSGLLAEKMAIAVSAGDCHSMALTSDGEVYTWGKNASGQLGDNSSSESHVPVAVSGARDLSGKQVVAIASGGAHSLAMFPSGPPSVISNAVLQGIRPGVSGPTATFTAAATDNPAPSVQWQVSVTGSDGIFTDILDNLTATTGTLILTNVSPALDGYAYRAVFTNNAGSCTTTSATLTMKSCSDLKAPFVSGTDTPLTISDNILISGSLDVVLEFAPTPGTSLTVINNTGLGFLNGTFSNIPQGGTISLNYNDTNYKFIANYCGGNGRSLVLQWPCTGLDAWGSNSHGQLGISGTADSWVPVTVSGSLALAGKTVMAIAGGDYHSLAVTSAGNIFAWGYNNCGQLGNASTINSQVPTPVGLAGATVVSVAAGGYHSMALTSNGWVFTWGYNYYGQLGDNSNASHSLPIWVSTSTGALTGKTIVAIAAGCHHSMALTSDGQVFAWGYNGYGQLGNNNKTNSYVPVAVSASGALTGKKAVAIAAGLYNSMALTSEGQVVTWGDNSSTPANVSGDLIGKTVIAIAAGSSHCMALTSDGRVFAWGNNADGQLGNNSTTNSTLPQEVSSSGALAGKTVVAIAAGHYGSIALTSDGQIFTWGNGRSLVPVALTGALDGKTVMAIAAGGTHSLALFAEGPPSISADPVNQLAILTGTSSATLNFGAAATDNPWPAVQWQVSTTGTAGPFSDIVGNTTATTGVLTLTNVTLAQNGYAYRAIFTNNAGSCTTTAAISTVLNGQDLQATFTSGGDIPVTASAVSVSGSLTVVLGFAPEPGTNLTIINNTGPLPINGTFNNVPQGGDVSLTYDGITYYYIANYCGGNGRSLVLEWKAVNMQATFTSGTDIPVTANTVSVSGSLTVVLGFAPTLGTNLTVINNTGPLPINGKFSNVPQGGDVSLTYDGITYYYIANYCGGNGRSLVLEWKAVNMQATFTSGTGIPVTTNAISVSGSLTVVLGFAPAPGTNLTVINNTGPFPINGKFSNVPQGGTIRLSYNGVTYNYTANYSGGNGKSLVLQYPCTGIFVWGLNNFGQLGVGGTSTFITPVSVSKSGALLVNTTVAVAGGGSHSLALSSSGRVYGWGANSNGQLGNSGTADSSLPTAVYRTGVLTGKTVVAIAGGESHSLALTSDGRVFAWGCNSNGQLGNSGTADSTQPVAVYPDGELKGKMVVAIAVGKSHSLALTSDGRVFAWGCNSYGQLGNSGTANSSVPVAVSAPAGQTVRAIAGGESHSLALTSEGQVLAWGYNNHGQLGIGNTTNTSVPVAIDTSASTGQTVVAIACGGLHSLALTSDGKVLGWGYNNCGQLATSGTASFYTYHRPGTLSLRYTPLNGKTVAGIAAGYSHSLALTSDGRVFAWGNNANGELGTGGPWSNWIPTPVFQYQSGELAGKTVMAIATGSSHNLAMFTSGPPSVTTNPIDQTGTSGTTVSFAAAAATANPAPTVQWQMSTTGTGGVFSNIVGNASATKGTLVLTNVTPEQNGYVYRAVFTNNAGSCTTDAATLSVRRTFGWFQGRYGLLNADPTADTNRTGICNLAAYAFGVDPGAPDWTQLPLASLQSGGLQISYPRWKDAADVVYVVEVSDDLQTWYSGASYTEEVSATPIDATREQVVVRDLIPISNAPHRFIRVRITH